jgi:hypothetical protein
MFLKKEFVTEYSFFKMFFTTWQKFTKNKSLMGEGHGLKGTVIR